ncbi:hypothetical protein GCM10011359_24290 [Nesterenkonia alkaliphila]|nr:hypothetical protein GCM10011359_24290 [Nesterenkonia alkaliphila]
MIEQASSFSEVGAGLGVTANDQRALDAIGADGALEREGQRIRPAGTQFMDGSWLMKLPYHAAGTTRMYGMHRQRLHTALLDAAAEAELSTGMRVVRIDPGGTDQQAVVLVDTANGQQRVPADLVVGAGHCPRCRTGHRGIRDELGSACRVRCSASGSR